jgi:hypothetical protein
MSDPVGVNCGTTCTFAFTEGTTLTLTANPHAGWMLKRWSGDCTGTALTCSLTMDAAHAAKAVFIKIPLVT